MIFCLGEGKYESKGIGYQQNLMIFNKKVTEEVYGKTKSAMDVKNFKLPISTWVDIKNIETPSDTQKQLGGYLKTLNYKDAWTEMWSGLSQEDKQFFSTLPNFDTEIFEKITGIKYETEDDVDITVYGKTIKISRKSAKALGLLT